MERIGIEPIFPDFQSGTYTIYVTSPFPNVAREERVERPHLFRASDLESDHLANELIPALK